jgi:hypothetical protein
MMPSTRRTQKMATLSVKSHPASAGQLAVGITVDEASQPRLVYRLGLWAAALVSVLNLVYMGIMVSLAFSGFVLPPPEPTQTIAGIITLLSAPTLVVLFAGVHYHAPIEKKILSHLSLVFMLGLTVLTCTNRYVQLTVVRQGIAAGKEAEVARFLPYSPDSIMNAMELLAWSLFFGLALLFAAPVFNRGRMEGWIRGMLVVTGSLGLLAFCAYLTGWTWLAYSGPVAWGITGPVAFFLMVPFFWRAIRHGEAA